ncbi:phospholipid carrier-dependent glycosyltransferase [Streptomyces rubellomurinus]|uniref:dolichyl-phosphate-mannose--protein mannosyltransferase n=1 Tax=Streptomyces rubellomurinus (strain ATCC 31215) TaxID=359131 RepID=UPI00099CBD3A
MWRMNGDTAAQTPTGTDHTAQGGVGLPSPRPPLEASPGWRERLSRFGRPGRAPVPLTERLVPPMPDGPRVTPRDVPQSPLLLRLGLSLPQGLWWFLCRWSGWLGPIAVALFAAVLRFVHLGQPNAIIFDETYYAKDAYALWHGGYEINWPEDANAQIMSGAAVPYRPMASYVVHPPVGKWIIGAGEQLFGMNPFGWRFSVALLGTLSVLMLARIARRMFRSTLLGCVAGLLLAVDGLHLVLSRAALLDLVVMFWTVAAFGFLLLDRDRTRARLAAALGGVENAELAQRLRLGWRPYRIAAGVCIGLTCATKWSGLYVMAAFGLMSVLWDVGARRLAGAPRPYAAVLTRDVLPAFVSVVLVSTATYVASWWGWFASSNAPGQGGWGRDWAVGRTTDYPWIPEGLRALWHYHSTVYEFHTNLHDPHVYQSNPWSWLVLGRPVSFYYESPKRGEAGCTAADCAREVLGIGTPLLWWAAVVALVYCLWRWAFRRDWRAGALLCGLAAGYLPWFLYQERTIFLFYAVVFVPFLVLAVTMLIGALIGPAGASRDRRIIGSAAAGLLVLMIVWNFLYFYPLFTGQTIPLDDWRARMWFNSWV